MTLAEKLLDIVKDIPDDKIAEIIDFAEYIRQKEEKETMDIVDSMFLEYDETFKELAK